MRRWIRSGPEDPITGEFAKQYERSKEIGLTRLGDEVIELADTATADNYNAIRLQIDSRKWYLSKLMPKIFGDRAHHQIESSVTVKQELPSDAELARILAAAISTAAEPIALEHMDVPDEDSDT